MYGLDLRHQHVVSHQLGHSIEPCQPVCCRDRQEPEFERQRHCASAFSLSRQIVESLRSCSARAGRCGRDRLRRSSHRRCHPANIVESFRPCSARDGRCGRDRLRRSGHHICHPANIVGSLRLCSARAGRCGRDRLRRPSHRLCHSGQQCRVLAPVQRSRRQMWQRSITEIHPSSVSPERLEVQSYVRSSPLSLYHGRRQSRSLQWCRVA